MRVIIRVSRPFWRSIWERRRFARRSIRDWPAERGHVKLRWQSQAGEKLLATIEYRNWSLRGLQVETPSEVPADTEVHVDGRQIGCMGLVRYCNRIGDGYRIGIKVTEWFTPDKQADVLQTPVENT